MIDPVTSSYLNWSEDIIYGWEANNNINFDPLVGKMILHKDEI